jgi:hypothetical protein
MLVMTSIGALGLGIGLALPRSTTAAVALLAVAVLSLATVGARADALAPSHGLNRVVRLSTTSAVSTGFDSCWSRIAGSARTLRERVSARLVGSPPELEDDVAVAMDQRATAETVIKVKTEYEPPNRGQLALPSPEGSEPALAGRR